MSDYSVEYKTGYNQAILDVQKLLKGVLYDHRHYLINRDMFGRVSGFVSLSPQDQEDIYLTVRGLLKK